MKNNKSILNTALAAVLFIALAVVIILRTVIPAVVLPPLNIPNMVLISAVALLIDQLIAKNAARCYICIPVFSFLTFGLLTFAAGYAGIMDALKYAVVGCVVFTVTTFLYTSIKQRLASGPASPLAPFMSAFGLYLAAQCFSGIIL